MRRAKVMALTVVAALALGSIVMAQGMAKGGSTFEGTLVDVKCYSMMPPENSDNDHMTPKGEVPLCGTVCAKMGIPVGVVTSDGKLYVLAVPSLQVADSVGKRVRATGAAKSNVVVADKLEVQDGGKWKEVNINTMM